MIHLNVCDLNESNKLFICDSLRAKGFLYYTDYDSPRTMIEVNSISLDLTSKRFFLREYYCVSTNEPFIYIKRR